jgi:hypothetical protein
MVVDVGLSVVDSLVSVVVGPMVSVAVGVVGVGVVVVGVVVVGVVVVGVVVVVRRVVVVVVVDVVAVVPGGLTEWRDV